MGRHTSEIPIIAPPPAAPVTSAIPVAEPAADRGRSPMTAVSAVAASLLVIGMAVVPFAPVQGVDTNGAHLTAATQSLDISTVAASSAKDAFGAEAAPVPVVAVNTAPAAGVPDPGTAQAIAYGMMSSYGWDDNEYNCLVALWGRESGWNVYAHNASSGAYGIPQALPGDKMATAGSDWATNPATQITWGFGYIASRYATPCGAWEHSELKGWY